MDYQDYLEHQPKAHKWNFERSLILGPNYHPSYEESNILTVIVLACADFCSK